MLQIIIYHLRNNHARYSNLETRLLSVHIIQKRRGAVSFIRTKLRKLRLKFADLTLASFYWLEKRQVEQKLRRRYEEVR
jgi:hypothetical protein